MDKCVYFVLPSSKKEGESISYHTVVAQKIFLLIQDHLGNVCVLCQHAKKKAIKLKSVLRQEKRPEERKCKMSLLSVLWMERERKKGLK